MSRFSYYIPILGYHRVGKFRGDHVPTVSADVFTRQLKWLKNRQFNVISLDEVADKIDKNESLPRKSTVITFDDGYEETYSIAWPILKQFGFGATVFVTPQEVGTTGFASWEQLIELSADGMDVGSHTMNHTYLPLMTGEPLWKEISDSKRIIEDKLNKSISTISYPVGGYTEEVQDAVKRAGYRIGCTTNRTMSINGIDRYALRRVKMTERDRHPLMFRAKVSGYYDLFRELKKPY